MKTTKEFNNTHADEMSMFADLLHYGACPYAVSFRHYAVSLMCKTGAARAIFNVTRSDKTNDEHWDRITGF